MVTKLDIIADCAARVSKAFEALAVDAGGVLSGGEDQPIVAAKRDWRFDETQ